MTKHKIEISGNHQKILFADYEIELEINESGLLQITAWHSADDYCDSVLSATHEKQSQSIEITKENYLQAMNGIQELGYAVAVFTENELDGRDPSDLEDEMISKGNDWINSTTNDHWG